MRLQPLLSVIIPTKNNAYYAERSVRAILTNKEEEIEIVVQDNSTNNDLKEALNDLIETKKITYNYSDENLSVIGNFNRAINASSGEYVCVIGDDDGIHPSILKAVKWAKKNGVEVIVPHLKAVYFWPGSSQKHKNGHLSISPFDGNITRYNPQDQFLKLLEAGCLDYLSFYLPKAYHGIVSRKKMDEYKEIAGNYFGGLTPDIYAVTGLSMVTKEVVYIDFPLTISGISPKSNSGKASKNQTKGRLEEAPHFNGHDNYHWSENVPRIFSGETIWADTLMHALEDMNRKDLITNFDSQKLHKRLWMRYKSLRNEIEEYYGKKPSENTKIRKYVWELIKFNAKKMPFIVNLVMKYKGIIIIRDVVDMNAAITSLVDSKYSSNILERILNKQ